MEKQTNDVIGQLKDRLLASSQNDIHRVVKEAQEEALQEAKMMLKERMLEAILKDAIVKVDQLDQNSEILVVEEGS